MLYLRNSKAYNDAFWYTCIKWSSFYRCFFSFLKFSFLGCSPTWKITFTSATHHISEQCSIWSWLLLHLGKIQKLSEYLPSMKLDDYSFKLHQKRVDKWGRTKQSVHLKVSYLPVVSEHVDKWKGGWQKHLVWHLSTCSWWRFNE